MGLVLLIDEIDGMVIDYLRFSSGLSIFYF